MKKDESGLGSAEACEACWKCSQPLRRTHDLAVPQPGLLQLMVRGAILEPMHYTPPWVYLVYIGVFVHKPKVVN